MSTVEVGIGVLRATPLIAMRQSHLKIAQGVTPRGGLVDLQGCGSVNLYGSRSGDVRLGTDVVIELWSLLRDAPLEEAAWQEATRCACRDIHEEIHNVAFQDLQLY